MTCSLAIRLSNQDNSQHRSIDEACVGGTDVRLIVEARAEMHVLRLHANYVVHFWTLFLAPLTSPQRETNHFVGCQTTEDGQC